MRKSQSECPQCGGRWWRTLVVSGGVPSGFLLLGNYTCMLTMLIDWSPQAARSHLLSDGVFWRVDECMVCGATMTA